MSKKESLLIDKRIQTKQNKITNKAFNKYDEKSLLTLTTVASQLIDKRDSFTAGHSIRVAKYSLLLGKALKIPKKDLLILHYAALMHDYGKIGVPEAILWKKGPLLPDEYASMQKHASYTYELLSLFPFKGELAAVPFIASCHHEKYDGKGYYRGLKGEEIPYLARIITIADVFDAITSDRHYRKRMPINKVIEIMIDGRGSHFQPEYVDTFLMLPSSALISIMESEYTKCPIAQIKLFAKTSFKRLVELVSGTKPKKHEEGLAKIFETIYNAGLPHNHQSANQTHC